MEKRFEEGLLLAEKAGRFLRENRNRPLVEKNFNYDVKLKQDRESEDIILKGIENLFPGDGFLSEERGGKKTLSGWVWIIDPLDGTVNYSSGIPHCCVSIACKKGNRCFGIVYDFFRDEMFKALKGKGAFLNGGRIRTSDTSDLKDAIMSFGLMKSREEITSGIDVFSGLALKVKKVRIMGAAALDLCYVASGRTDFFVETGLNAWDVAAGRIIVEEAGGEYREFNSGHSSLFYAGNKSMDMESLCTKLAGV